MSNAVNSKAAMIGYYEGSMKIALRYLKESSGAKRNQEVKDAIRCLERTLREGDEIWQRVKGRE